MSHKVRLHNWINGILTFVDHMFEDFEQALDFAKKSDADSFKIYDRNDQVLHHSEHDQTTYA